MFQNWRSTGMLCVLLLSAWLLPGFSCDQPCTMIGCLNGVTLELVDIDGIPVVEFEAEVDIDGEIVDYACPNGAGCLGAGVLIVQTSADALHVRIASEAGEFEGEIRPEYDETFPNGEHCEPACLQARETLTLSP